jgi:hypothetical protein
MTTSIYAKNSTQSAIQTNGVDSLVMDVTGVVSGVDNGFKPLSAVATANTVVITMGTCSTIFRPTTLATGAAVQLSNVSPLTLTIPQGATLGSVNAVAARYIVLELNATGTKELAVVNQSGGVDLSEMGLISTTAMSAGATSASVVYSTTARTSVAYRVVGCIDSTQAVAGTYATALSLVQPAGGQALTNTSGLGQGQIEQNLIGSRTANTTYFNTTGRPIEVTVTVTNSTTTYFMVALSVGSYWRYSGVSNTTPTGNAVTSISAVVRPGGSYRIELTAANIYVWTELR